MRMEFFFYPAIALMNRLGYFSKFALLWLLSLIATAVVVVNLHASLEKDIHTSRRELDGLALIKPLFQAVQLIQQHRGLSLGFLGGREGMGGPRAAREKEIIEAFDRLQERLPSELSSSAEWRDIEAGWGHLRAGGLQWTAEENFAAHTRLIRQILLFQVHTADEYGLTLDFEIDPFYMIDTSVSKLPEALELLGQVRASGTGMLSGKQATEQQRVRINTLTSHLRMTLDALESNIRKTGRRNPKIRDALSTAFDAITASARQIVGIVETDIVTGRFASSPEDFYETATAALDKGYAQMYDTLLPATGALLDERIARAEALLRASIGIALLLALVVAYFAVGIYLAISRNVLSLARSARAFAGGDLRQRVSLESRDELGQVGDSFNEMADGFGALLEERKRAEEALRESETRLLAIFEQAAVGIAQVSPDGRWMDVNQRICDIVGYTREELLAITFQDITHPDDLEADLGYVRQMLAGEIQTYSMEKRYFRKDGAVIWINLTASLVRYPSGAPKYFISVVEDITQRKQEEKSRRENEAKFSAVFNSSQVSFSLSEVSETNGQQVGKLIDVNPTFCQVTGYSREEAIGHTTIELNLISPADQQRILKIANQDGEFANFEFGLIRRDGTICPTSLSRKIIHINGRPYRLGAAVDITGRKQAEQALIESSEKFRSVIETALDAVVQMDAGGIITGWNRQAEKIFGWSAAEAIGRILGETIVPPRYRAAHAHGLENLPASGEGAILNSRVELTGLHRDGHEFPIELSVTAVRTAGRVEFNGFIHDITDRKKAEELIWKQANYDPLTGLPNRRMSHDRLVQETRKTHRSRLPLALLFIDLDKFKEVNDTLGHDVGDILLVEAAHRIGGCVRETDTVARLGGDEFTVILMELDDIRRVDMLAQNILHALAEPFQLGSEVVHLSASIGITLYPNDTTEAGELLKNADQAMYAAKNAGGNRFSYFTPSMQQAALSRLRLIGDLRGALAGGQFRVYFQPIVELATGRIHKAEALIRWQHPARGMVSPADFIPLAEETGLIVEIGDWVFRETARLVKRWRERYNPELQVSVNESPVQFRSDNSLHGSWPTYLQELELPGQSMVVEITEGLLLNAEPAVLDKLRQFHSAGIQISLDDFGTGYSSLSYLQKFDLDYLKIDQSFTRNLVPGSDSMVLCEAIIVMAHKLGMKVIAEGIETEQQRDLLAAAGCDYGQGYLFSRPLPPEEFESLFMA